MHDDDTPRLDRQRLERLLGKESADMHAAWESQLTEPDRLRNERDALIRYARALEREMHDLATLAGYAEQVRRDTRADLRAEYGVAALLEDA